jgi:hypothetical protein
MNAGSTLVSTVTGISAVANGTSGAVNVAVNGTIDAPDVGVNAKITNAVNPNSVGAFAGANGNITANDIGINATTAGTGAVNVTTLNGSQIFQGTNGGVQNGNVAAPLGGIVTSSTSGNTSINVGGAVTANAFGINATTTAGGSINVTTGAGAVTGDIGATGTGSANLCQCHGGRQCQHYDGHGDGNGQPGRRRRH